MTYRHGGSCAAEFSTVRNRVLSRLSPLVFCSIVYLALLPGPFAAGAAGAGVDDALNERPPVTRLQLERHWGVDCTRLRDELLETPLFGASAVQLARWRESLVLCSAVHNAPGAADALACPDYAAAARLLAELSEDHIDRHANEPSPMRSILQCDH